jgi:hypothetical protein
MPTPDVARALSDRSVRLLMQGRPAEAMLSEQEAVAIYRELAETHPDHNRPLLARLLDDLGAIYATLGRTAEAEEAREEAERIRGGDPGDS